MVTKFKLFEKLGIDNTASQVSEKVWKEFLKYFNEKKVFSDKIDKFNVNIKEFNFKNINKLEVTIEYNKTESSKGYNSLFIGAIDRNNENIPKSMQQLKGEIFHEIKHMIFFLHKHGLSDRKKINQKPNKIFSSERWENLFRTDIIGNTVFKNQKFKLSLQNFLEHANFSKSYKKILVYLYLANSDEMTARLNEIYPIVMSCDELDDVLSKQQVKINLEAYKDMSNFKININDLSNSEKEKIFSFCPEKNIKKLEKYFNKNGEKFVRKFYKLTYFLQNKELSKE